MSLLMQKVTVGILVFTSTVLVRTFVTASSYGHIINIYIRKKEMKTLKYKNTGNDVDRLQSLLGIPTNSSHEFDMVTNDKVVEFQKAHGLVADGIVGYRTWEALLF